VATSNTGGWVRRVGASGGGRAYRRRRPVNYYGVIGLVVVLGFASVTLARYDYRKHPPAKPTPVQTFVALGLDVCGKRPAVALAANPAAAGSGYEVLRDGVLYVYEPAGTGTVGGFVATYRGLTLTSSELQLPLKHAVTLHTGDRCPAGTPDAGKVGQVEVATWPNQYSTAPPRISTNPDGVRFTNDNMLVTIAFVPKGSAPLRPAKSVITALFSAPGEVTTTTVPTIPPSSTTTTHPKGTTTTTIKR